MEPSIEHDTNINQELKADRESTAALFIKVGIVVLSILMIVGFGIKVFPSAITVTSTGSRWDIPISCVNTENKEIALSFDSDWSNEDTQSILTVLSNHNIRATFFMTGEWISKYPEDVKAIAEAGHDLGNHSDNHLPMSQLSKKECASEIMNVHEMVNELTGINMTLFRAPYGDYNDTLVSTARECGYYMIQWNVDVYATTLKPINTRV